MDLRQTGPECFLNLGHDTPAGPAYGPPAERGRIKTLAEEAEKAVVQAAEKLKASGRAFAQHPFHMVQNLFRHRKVRERGRANVVFGGRTRWPENSAPNQLRRKNQPPTKVRSQPVLPGPRRFSPRNPNPPKRSFIQHLPKSTLSERVKRDGGTKPWIITRVPLFWKFPLRWTRACLFSTTSGGGVAKW